MSQVVNGVETPASNLIILETLIINFIGMGISKQIIKPKEQNSKPGSPERPALPHVSLKLN